MSKFTKGDWSISEMDHYPHEIVINIETPLGRRWICEIANPNTAEKANEINANAHLISAAPDMYEALASLQKECIAKGWNIEKVNKALAKANGVSDE